MADQAPNPKSRATRPTAPKQASGEHQVKHNYLLAIAVDHYDDPDISNLSNCVEDIEDLMAVLTQDYFFNAENIRYLRSRLRQPEDTPETLSAQAEREKLERKFAHVGEATHEAIIEQLKTLAKEITPADNVVICYSGHGIYDQDFNEGYWIPANGGLSNNASYVENATIRTALNAIKSHHTVLISDSCYSGTLFSSGKQRSLDIPRVYQYPSRWGLTAGRRNETVSDGNVGDNSPFAKELIRILKRKQEVWIGDLCKEIVTELTNRSEAQTPMGEPFADMKAHDGGQFVFLPRLATEKDYWRIAWRENTRKGYFAFLARYPNGEYEDVALEALSVFAGSRSPAFSEEALSTYEFLVEVLPEQAKTYVVNYLKGATQTVLSDTALELYRDLMEHLPEVAKSELKTLVLGRVSEQLPVIEAGYAAAREKSAAAAVEYLKEVFQPVDRNPYRGLPPYRTEDSEVFFGRKAAIAEVATRLYNSDCLVIIAPPYRGKSSLVYAGLYPHLHARENYELLAMRPGRSPLERLGDLAERIDPERKQLLLIDQYEELFTEGAGAAERADFENTLLLLCAQAQANQLKVVLTLRSSFEWQVQHSVWGKQYWHREYESRMLYRVPELSRDEMRETIIGPAWARARDFESAELVEQILDEARRMPNSLPLLSFAMREFYGIATAKNELVFTLDTYREDLNSIHGALDRFAGEVYEKQPPEAQRIMRKLFLRMVLLGGKEYGARRVAYGDPSAGPVHNELFYADEQENAHVEQLVEAMLQAQLLQRGEDQSGQRYLEPVHDLLISSWPRCREWIEDFGTEQLALQRDIWRATLTAHREAQGRARTFSKYWDNNPKLASILDQLLESGTSQLNAEPAGPLAQAIDALSQSLEGEARDRFDELLRNWRTNGQPENLDQFIITGASDQLLAIFLRHSEHWLNAAEVEFVQKSWAKRSADITDLYRQRDEAVAAKQEAEAGQREIAELLRKSAVQSQAFKRKYREQTRKDFHVIQAGFKLNLHLILVGVDDYPKSQYRLQGCVNDAKSIAEAFDLQEGKLYEKVTTHLLTDAEATRDNILERVATVQQQAGLFDFVIVYLSGHGSLNDAQDGIFMPVDFETAGSISGQEFCTQLFGFQSKVILIVDIVNGGDFLGTLAKANQSEDLDQVTHNVFGISSASPGEMAYETRIGGISRGVFSWALEQCFRTEEADLDGNKVVYLDEMLRYTSEMVRKKVDNQNVYTVVPATMANIPLLQFGDEFALPQQEIALGGHIEDDAVIDGVLTIFAPEADLLDDEVLQLFQEGDYDKLIHNISVTLRW